MKKKLIVFSCIAAFLAASAAMLVWLRYSARNISVLQQLSIEQMFLKDPTLSLRYIRYYEDSDHFDIHCKYKGNDIDDNVYDSRISLYNNILSYICEKDPELGSVKFEMYICNGPPTYYLQLKNYLNSDENDVRDECISAYSGMDGAFYYSDEKLFHDKYPMIKLDH